MTRVLLHVLSDMYLLSGHSQKDFCHFFYHEILHLNEFYRTDSPEDFGGVGSKF